ncbi:MAG: recombinase family protein [Bacillota bacterium]
MSKHFYISTVPFGYRANENQSYDIQEDEAKVVREIFKLYMLYQSCKKVMNVINNDDSLMLDVKFSIADINRVLNNYFYTGNQTYIKKSKERHGKVENKVIPFHHIGIIPLEVWDNVQELRKKYKSKREGN